MPLLFVLEVLSTEGKNLLTHAQKGGIHLPWLSPENLTSRKKTRSVLGGAFIPATIIAKSSSGTSFLVEFKTLKPKASIGVEKNKVKPLMEELDASLLRPSLPREREDYAYQPGQEVDAYHNGRWWEGVITEILEGSSKVSVYLHVKVELEFEPSRLRPHREWVEGKWVPPLQDKNVSASSGAKAAEESLVEVRIDEEGFEGSWYASKIIQDVGEDKYLVQYRTVRTDTGEKFLKEEVDKRNIRPYPPQTIMIDRYDQNEEVDTFHNDGLWVGVISKILSRGMFRVYFEHTDEEIVFEH
ncbi:Agenet-like domain containing protein [Parasponia andersonii]|uniref:Agenet-like domain containing protein n=1 Tax=Parasponia andersonii TaxID=3476 RepID=A0A2P5CHD7_PARAD|nr:Agenet-like domain containing protein [Parasponia andersonii]